MQRASQLLQKVVDSKQTGKVALGDFLEQLGSQSFALTILLLSLPHAIPFPEPPGLSAITGLPILIIACQMALGRESIRLPQWLAKKKFSPKLLRSILSRMLPVIRWFEKFLHPRSFLPMPVYGDRIIGVVVVVLAAVLCLPIPGGNLLPGISVFLLALAVLSRDSLFALFGLLVSAASLYIMYAVIAKAIESTVDWISASV